MEAIKADYFVTPTVEYRLAHHEAGPMPRLITREGLKDLLHPAKLTAHGGGCLQRRKQTGDLSIFRFLRYFSVEYCERSGVWLGGDIPTRCLDLGRATNLGV